MLFVITEKANIFYELVDFNFIIYCLSDYYLFYLKINLINVKNFIIVVNIFSV